MGVVVVCGVWAHPRVCGENLCIAGARSPATGSSPRVRGKRLIGTEVDRRRRLIPACAGKTRRAKCESII